MSTSERSDGRLHADRRGAAKTPKGGPFYLLWPTPDPMGVISLVTITLTIGGKQSYAPARRSPWMEKILRTRALAALLWITNACAPGVEFSLADQEPGYFTESSVAYEIGPVVARVPELDTKITMAGAITAVETEDGWMIGEAGNHRLTFLDQNLNLVRTAGRQGDGPGEYRFIRRITPAGDRFVVMDWGNNRASFVKPDGSFLESASLRPNPTDVAWHSQLGLLIADDGSDKHYLSRLHEGEQTSIARIPAACRIPDDGFHRSRTNLLAVTPDGLIHVFDGLHLVLVSYAADGTLLSSTFLPEPARLTKLNDNAKTVDALGGRSRVVASWLATMLQPLPDGRLFIRTGVGGGLGYLLDPARLEATIVVLARSHEAMAWNGRNVRLAGNRVLFHGVRDGPQAAIAEVELVQR